MINALLLVGIGGAAGSMLRHVCQKYLNGSLPYGTLLVNIAGCLFIGIIWGLLSRHGDEQRKLLLATGFCGGFTTFSAFTQEGIQLMMEDRWLTFAFYTGLSVVAGLMATYLGFKLTSS